MPAEHSSPIRHELGTGASLGLLEHRAWENWALDPSVAMCPLWSLTLGKAGMAAPDGWGKAICLLGSIPLLGRAIVSCHGVLDQTGASLRASHTVPHCSAGVALPEWGADPSPVVLRAVTPLLSSLTWRCGAGRGQHGKKVKQLSGKQHFLSVLEY